MAERAELAIVLTDGGGPGGGAGGGGGPAGPAGPQAISDEVGRLRQFLDQYLGPVGGILKQAGALSGAPGKIEVVPSARATAAQTGGLPEVLPAGGGMLEMAGAAAAPLALAEGIARLQAGAINTAAGGIAAAGEAAQKLAGNDGLGALLGASEKTAQTLQQIPIVGQVYAAEIRLATGAISTFRDTINAFVERGRQLAPLSGELTQAGVTADVRSLLADIREANELGPDLARLTDAQSRAWQEVREILLPIKKVIVENLADWVEMLASKLEGTGVGTAVAAEELKLIREILASVQAGDIAGAVQGLLNMPEKLKKALEDALKKPEDVQDAIDRQLADLAAQQGQALGGPPDPVRQAAQQGLQIPLF